MNVGQFFVSLGIKGSEKSLAAVTGVTHGMGDLKSMSLEAKAAIIGAVYAFERMMSSSAKAGMEFKNFAAYTGMSDQVLQKWQYAGRQVGVTNEEIANSFKTVQSVMGGLARGQMPEGMAYLTTQLAKAGTRFDPAKAMKDTEYAMQKFQQFAGLEKDVNKRNWALKSMGLSEGMISGMTRQAFRPDIMTKAPTYGEHEIGQLDKANAAWSNLGTKVEMAFGHFNAKHGVELVNSLSQITGQVIRLVEALMKVAEAFHLFQGIGKLLGITADVVGGAADTTKKITSDKQGITAGLVHTFAESSIGKALMSLPSDMGDIDQSKQKSIPKIEMTPGKSPITPGTIAPPLTKNVQPNSTQNNSVNQTFHFQTDGSDHKQVGNETQKAVKNAFFQIPQFGGW